MCCGFRAHRVQAGLSATVRPLSTSNKKEQSVSKGIGGAPGEIRTPDPLLRRQTLYPTELRAPN